MLKKEQVWREILHQCFAEGNLVFTQKDLAGKLKVSLSTVNNALRLPRTSGAVAVTGRNFQVKDREKFLLLWASHRNLAREQIYATYAAGGVPATEGLVPPGAIFAAFSALVKKYKTAPADYDAVYIYADTNLLPEIKKRFPLRKGAENLFVLRADPLLKHYGEITPDVQTFADLWNLPQWYAKDFLKDLKAKLRI